MIVRDFKPKDLLEIDVRALYNPGLEYDEVFEELMKIGKTYPCQTIVDNDKPLAILLFKAIDAADNYQCMAILSRAFKPIHTRIIKENINKLMDRVKAKSAITFSVDVDTVNKWHKLLGFEDTGVLANVFGYRHKLWKMVKEN